MFGDGLVDVLCCGGDSLEEDLHWGPRLGALVDLVEFEDGQVSRQNLKEASQPKLSRQKFLETLPQITCEQLK